MKTSTAYANLAPLHVPPADELAHILGEFPPCTPSEPGKIMAGFVAPRTGQPPIAATDLVAAPYRVLTVRLEEKLVKRATLNRLVREARTRFYLDNDLELDTRLDDEQKAERDAYEADAEAEYTRGIVPDVRFATVVIHPDTAEAQITAAAKDLDSVVALLRRTGLTVVLTTPDQVPLALLRRLVQAGGSVTDELIAARLDGKLTTISTREDEDSGVEEVVSKDSYTFDAFDDAEVARVLAAIGTHARAAFDAGARVEVIGGTLNLRKISTTTGDSVLSIKVVAPPKPNGLVTYEEASLQSYRRLDAVPFNATIAAEVPALLRRALDNADEHAGLLEYTELGLEPDMGWQDEEIEDADEVGA